MKNGEELKVGWLWRLGFVFGEGDGKKNDVKVCERG